MEDLTTITVDGKKISTPKGTLLWEACKAQGIDIPIFCYHTKLGPVGACRTCLVEVEGMTKGPITACSTPVTDGMIVRTRSPIVEKAQRGIFEFLLANHPLDCPICDRAGECPLQDQTFAFGAGTSRYIEPKRHHEKPIVLGPTIALDRERCVLCWRCVRFCAEVAEDKSIILLDRGEHTIVGTFQDEPYVSNFSGNVVELCPVGALTSRKQRFNFRPWELRDRPSICPHCPMGCNINVSVRKNDEVIRFLSRDNPEIDDSWLCDRGRFNFEFINSPERLTAPLVRSGDGFVETSWSEALELIAQRLQGILEESGPESVAGVASPRLSNEDLFVFKRFMAAVVGTSNIDHYPRPQSPLTSEQQSALDRLDRQLTSISALDKARTVLLLGANPSEREPVMELRIRMAINRNGARLVVISPDEIPLSAKANEVMMYPSSRFADVVRALGSARFESGETVSRDTNADTRTMDLDLGKLREIARSYLQEGPLVILYDDTFEGIEDKGEALTALASFVEDLSASAEVGLIPMLDRCNSMGARDLGILPLDGMGAASWGRSVVSELLSPNSRIRAALLLGANLPEASLPSNVASRLRQLDLLVVHELFLTPTARQADVILPAASFAEKIGTFTNTERRIQRLTSTVPSPGIARSDWEILVDLSQYFDAPIGYGGPEQVWDDIRRSLPKYAGLSYDEIGASGILPAALQPA